MTHRSTTDPPHDSRSGRSVGRPNKHLDKTLQRAEYAGSHAKAKAGWDGLPKQIAKTAKNTAIVKSLYESNPHHKRLKAPAAHEHVKTWRERVRGAVVRVRSAEPADRRELRRQVLTVYRTALGHLPTLADIKHRSAVLADENRFDTSYSDLNWTRYQLEGLTAMSVIDGRKQDRSDPVAAEEREAERQDLLVDLEQSLTRTRRYLHKRDKRHARPLRDLTALETLISALRQLLPNRPATISKT